MPPLMLAMGPCLWFYTRHLIRSGHNSQRDRYHWLVPGLLLVAATGGLLWLGPAGSAYDLSQPRDEWGVVFWLFNLPTLVVVPLYALACLALLRRHRASAVHQFSNLEGVRLRWLSVLAALWVVACFSAYLLPPAGLPRSFWFSPWAVLLIYFIGYMGVRQPAMVGAVVLNAPGTEQAGSEQARNEPGERAAVAQGSEAQWQNVQQQVAEQKLFLKPNLNLAKLSEALALPASQLSALINHHAGCHFFEYINRYRVEEAKQQLRDSTCQASVLDIALASGFNSKTAFYRQFKQHTGLTPTQFKNGQAQAGKGDSSD
jgi:AraC-like DNA-binding protein